jgi:hypothetical protein
LEKIPPEGGEWRIEETDSSDIVRIVIPYEDQRHSDIVDIDLSKGANIVRCAVWSDYGTPQAVRSTPRLNDVVLEEHGGVWLPASLAVYYLGSPNCVNRVTLRYDAVNESLDESDFVLEFPLGVQVVDMMAHVNYYVRVPKLVGKEAPALDVAEWVNREPVRLSALRGRTVVLAFWDSAHESSAQVIQVLHALAKRYPDVEVLAVHCADGDRAALKRLVGEEHSAFHIALDKRSSSTYPGATFEKYNVNELPAVFITNAEGKVSYQDIPLAAVEEAVKRLLHEQGR